MTVPLSSICRPTVACFLVLSLPFSVCFGAESRANVGGFFGPNADTLQVTPDAELALGGIEGPLKEEYRESGGQAYAMHVRVAKEKKGVGSDLSGNREVYPLPNWARVRGKIVRVFPEGVIVEALYGDKAYFVTGLPRKVVSGAKVDALVRKTGDTFKFKARFGEAFVVKEVYDFGHPISKEQAQAIWDSTKTNAAPSNKK